MPYHYTDPSREARECPECHGAREVQTTRVGPCDWKPCARCNGTGQLGDPHALPDVEVFWLHQEDLEREWPEWLADVERDPNVQHGAYYAYGSPGCLWDSDPVGPFTTEAEALAAAREGE